MKTTGREEGPAQRGGEYAPWSVARLCSRHQSEPLVTAPTVGILAVLALDPRTGSRQHRKPALDIRAPRSSPNADAAHPAIPLVRSTRRRSRRRRHVPDPDRLVRSPRDEHRALARPAQALDRRPLRVTPESLDALARRERPQDDQAVVAGRGEVPPVGRDLDDLDGRAMADKDANAMPLLDVPKTACTVGRPSRQVKRVRVERQALSGRACLRVSLAEPGAEESDPADSHSRRSDVPQRSARH